jgi:hypothetical protein
MGYNEPTIKGVVMPRFAMRITEEILDFAESLTGARADFDDNLYMVITIISSTEYNLKLMSEYEVFVEFKNDSTLQVLN